MLSKRIERYLEPSPIFDYWSRTLAYAYHKTDNPGGVILLGIDDNTLMAEEISEILSIHMRFTSDIFECHSSSAAITTGLLELYNNAPFNPIVPVEKEHIYFTAGCSMLFERLLWALCDAEEAVLIGRPSYFTDISGQSNINPIYVSFKGVDPLSLEAVHLYEEELLQSNRDGLNVRILILSQRHDHGKYVPDLNSLTLDVTPVRSLSNTYVFARNTRFIFF